MRGDLTKAIQPEIVWSDWDGESGAVVHTVAAVLAGGVYMASMAAIGTVGAVVSVGRWLLHRGR